MANVQTAVSAMLFPVLLALFVTIAAIIIGSTYGQRAGAGRPRLVQGLAVIAGGQWLSVLLAAIHFMILTRIDMTGGAIIVSLVGVGGQIVSTAVLIVGLVLLASAVVQARGGALGSYDPSNPGAPPLPRADGSPVDDVGEPWGNPYGGPPR